MTPTWFRVLLLAHIGSGVLALVLYFALESPLPPTLREYLAAETSAPLTAGDVWLGAVAIILLLLWLSALSGLYRLAAWARPLTVALYGAGLLVVPLLGPANVEPAISGGLTQLSSLLLGAVLAVSYLPPASAWFHNRPRHARAGAHSAAGLMARARHD